jgi:hypothetical protein
LLLFLFSSLQCSVHQLVKDLVKMSQAIVVAPNLLFDRLLRPAKRCASSRCSGTRLCGSALLSRDNNQISIQVRPATMTATRTMIESQSATPAIACDRNSEARG